MYEKKYRFTDVHPLRWRRSRPFSGALLRTAANHEMGKHMSAQFMQAGVMDIMPSYNPAIMKLPVEKRPENPLTLMNKELTVAMYATAFWSGNRNVVAMDPALLELLQHTDADNVPMDAIRWTHPFIYIALPPGNGISLPGDDNEFDGAYVDSRLEGHLQIALTTRRTDVETRRQTWPVSTEPYFTFSEKLIEGETVGEFVSRCVENRVADLLSDRHEQERQQAIATANADPEIGHASGRHYESVAQRNNAIRADDVEKGAPAAARALALVVNLMCYLSTEPPLAHDYSPQPPRALAQRAASGTDRQKRLAREEMARLSILPIKVAGRGSQPTAAEDGTVPTGRTTASHWRKGYYNKYWTGVGRKILRLVWIAPQIINGHLGAPRGIHMHPVITD
jgi:hypothetical protein